MKKRKEHKEGIKKRGNQGRRKETRMHSKGKTGSRIHERKDGRRQ